MTELGWEIVSEKSKKYNSDEFLRVKPDCELKIRLIGRAFKVTKLFRSNNKCIVVDSEETGKELKSKYDDMVSNVSVRHMCWCIDRDDGTMKILDLPFSVAKEFANRARLIDKKISGNEQGCDWSVRTNGKKGKDVRYRTVYLDETPLTEDEQQTVKDNIAEENSTYDLNKIFKSCSFVEAEEKLLA